MLYGQLILSKIVNIVATRCPFLRQKKSSKSDFGPARQLTANLQIP